MSFYFDRLLSLNRKHACCFQKEVIFPYKFVKVLACPLWKTFPTSSKYHIFTSVSTPLENLADDAAAWLYVTKISTISLYLIKLYIM